MALLQDNFGMLAAMLTRSGFDDATAAGVADLHAAWKAGALPDEPMALTLSPMFTDYPGVFGKPEARN